MLVGSWKGQSAVLVNIRQADGSRTKLEAIKAKEDGEERMDR